MDRPLESRSDPPGPGPLSPPRSPRVFARATLAIAALSLAAIGASRARPPGADREALLSRVDGETLAATTEACRTALLNGEAKRVRAGGYGALAIPVRLADRETRAPGSATPPSLPPEATARRLAAARHSLASEGVRAIPVVEVASGESCRSRRARAFVARFRDAVRESAAAAAPPGPKAGERGNSARVDAHEGTPADDVLCRGEGAPTAVFEGGTGDGLPGAIVEETGLPDVANGDFRRGWDGWRTRGRVALEPPTEPIAEACFPLVARLDRGGAISQSLSGGLPDLAHDVGVERTGEGEVSHPAAELVFEVVPEPSERALVVRLAGESHDVVLPAAASSATIAIASRPEAGDDLSIEVPAEARGSVAIASVRLLPAGPALAPAHARVALAPWQVVSVAVPSAGDPPPGNASIELATTADLGAVAFSPDEMNAWKLYVYFGREHEPPGLDRSPGWLRRTLPWVTHLRFPAAIGGNFCDEAPVPCRSFDRTSARPSEIDCFDAPSSLPASHEILRAADGRPRLDFTTWGRTIDEVLDSGMLPHLNVSSAPCAFTDGLEFNGYRWNERPVVRHAEWRGYVREVAREISRRPEASSFRFSIVNEPNCRWVLGERLPTGRHRISMLHVGYAGDAGQYATQYAETAAEILSVLPDAWVQLGNFTIGGGSPLEDNLPEFLAAVDTALDGEGVDPGRLRAISMSLYETPQHGLDEIPAMKLGRLARWRTDGSPFRDLPVKLDEVGVMELVAQPFRERTGTDLQTTRWTAAWHAELLGLAIGRGFVSQAPWLTQMFADRELTEPRALYWTYALAALALGDVVPEQSLGAPGALLPVEAAERTPRRLRSFSSAAGDPDGIGHVALEDAADGSLWIFAWRHDPRPVVDREADAHARLRLDVSLPARLHGAVATVVSLDGTKRGSAWSFPPFASSPTRAAEVEVRGGRLSLEVPSESVQLVRLGGERA